MSRIKLNFAQLATRQEIASNQVHNRRHAVICLIVLTFVLVGNSRPLATPKRPQGGWQLQIEEGKTTRATLTLGNRCQGPHQFRVENKIKYLRFEQSTAAIPIAPGATAALTAVIDASRLKAGVHRDRVVVKCLDCKQDKGCTQDRDEVPVEVTVTKRPSSAARMARAGSWGICCTLVGSGDKLTCASPATNQFDEVIVTGHQLGTLHRLDRAIMLDETATFFAGEEWKTIFPQLDRFPRQINLLRNGLPMLRFESPEKGVVRYLGTRQTREQITRQMHAKKKTPIQGVELVLTVRPK